MRFLFFAAFLFAFGCLGSAAQAEQRDGTGIVRRYAGALLAFNPRLSSAGSESLARRVIADADETGLDARLVVALVAVESRWHPLAVSPAGAIGLGQLMPATARGLGVDPRDAEDNLRGTIAHLAYLVRTYGGRNRTERYVLALCAYNAGEGAVAHYGGMPPYQETQRYVRDVVALWRRLAGF